MVKSYRDLVAWQKSMTLVKEVYNLTKAFPKEEQFGLTSQLKRAVISVPSNIAEGSSKKSTADFIRFLNISYGSLAEVGTQIEIAEMLNFINKQEEIYKLIDEVEKIISGLINSLAKKTQLSILNSNN
jgi:four helix bundle protein